MDLSNNSLRSFANKTYPKLQTLDLTANLITVFTNNYLPNLKNLFLVQNTVIDFNELLYFKNLQYVYLSGSRLTADLLAYNVSNWVFLNASACGIQNFHINKMENLTTLDLSQNLINNFSLWTGFPSLQTLLLKKCMLNNIEQLSLPSLTTLDLSLNNLT